MDLCVYIHIRLDTFRVFYIGQGTIRRAYDKQARNRYWKDVTNRYAWKVCIVRQGLTRDDAKELERRLIIAAKRTGRATCNLSGAGNDSGSGVQPNWKAYHALVRYAWKYGKLQRTTKHSRGIEKHPELADFFRRWRAACKKSENTPEECTKAWKTEKTKDIILNWIKETGRKPNSRDPKGLRTYFRMYYYPSMDTFDASFKAAVNSILCK